MNTVYNTTNTAELGKPVRVFDAEGVEYKYCVEVVVETGQITCYKRTSNGTHEVRELPPEPGDTYKRFEPVLETIMAPAPLRIEPVNK